MRGSVEELIFGGGGLPQFSFTDEEEAHVEGGG